MTIRQAAVAGMFYQDEPAELKREVEHYMRQTEAPESWPKAIIAPHAGYIYSGPVAGKVYGRLLAGRQQIRRVVLLGPSHRVPFRGLALSSADSFQTPLGNVPLDQQSQLQLAELPQVQYFDAAHAHEHSLEVQLPFLQMVLEDFVLLPLVVGDATGEMVSGVLEKVWGGPETLVVISSDLSHYQSYAIAQRQDRSTSEAILAMQPAAISHDDACGRIPIMGLLLCASRLGMQSELVDLRNSGDTAGDKNRVVGYGAYAFH